MNTIREEADQSENLQDEPVSESSTDVTGIVKRAQSELVQIVDDVDLPPVIRISSAPPGFIEPEEE